MIRSIHLLAVTATTVAAAAVGTVSVAASSSVPFKVSIAGSAAFTSATTAEFNGGGTAILMGAVTNEGTIQITGQDSSCPGGVANVNTEVVTAANGDTLTLTSQDVSCPTGPGTFQGSGSWHVSGGTGRFRGATGSGRGTGSGDFNVGRFQNTFTGTFTLAH